MPLRLWDVRDWPRLCVYTVRGAPTRMVFLHKVQAVAVLACIHSELDFCFNVDPARRVSTRWHYIEGWAVVMMHERAAAAAWIWLIDWKKSNFFFDFPAQRHRFIKGFFAVVARCRARAEASATEICPKHRCTTPARQHCVRRPRDGTLVAKKSVRTAVCNTRLAFREVLPSPAAQRSGNGESVKCRHTTTLSRAQTSPSW